MKMSSSYVRTGHVYLPSHDTVATASTENRTYVRTLPGTRIRTMVYGHTCTYTCMQALVRIQAYMLADIVVAIPAVDLAIEAVVASV